MRSFLLTTVILTSAASLVAVSGGLSGCKKKEKAAEKAAETEQATPSTTAARDAKRLGRFHADNLGARLGLQPVTKEEVAPMVPQLSGATPLGEPTSTGGGRRVTAIHCLSDGTDLAKVQAEIESKLTALGFTSIKSRQHGKQDVMTVSAEKPPYRLAASVRRGPFPDCPADQNKVKVLMTYFKRVPPPSMQPGANPAQPGSAAPAAVPAGGAVPAQSPAPTPPNKP